jgi:hypothetical protein
MEAVLNIEEARELLARICTRNSKVLASYPGVLICRQPLYHIPTIVRKNRDLYTLSARGTLASEASRVDIEFNRWL